jgi:hypothetical protein
MDTQTKKTFNIVVGERTHELAGRAAAIDKARELSDRTWRKVQVTRADRRVEMTFRRGELSTYTFHTRGRHS